MSSSNIKIPDYYRMYQKQPADKKENKTPVQTQQNQQKKTDDKTKQFLANSFTINMLSGWQDKTIYTLTGPVTDGIQHNVIINVNPEVPFDNLIDYADWQIKTLEEELKSCRLLKRGGTKLDNGTDAYEADFSWMPVENLRIFQHMIFILVKNTAFQSHRIFH